MIAVGYTPEELGFNASLNAYKGDDVIKNLSEKVNNVDDIIKILKDERCTRKEQLAMLLFLAKGATYDEERKEEYLEVIRGDTVQQIFTNLTEYASSVLENWQKRKFQIEQLGDLHIIWDFEVVYVLGQIAIAEEDGKTIEVVYNLTKRAREVLDEMLRDISVHSDKFSFVEEESKGEVHGEEINKALRLATALSVLWVRIKLLEMKLKNIRVEFDGREVKGEG